MFWGFKTVELLMFVSFNKVSNSFDEFGMDGRK